MDVKEVKGEEPWIDDDNLGAVLGSVLVLAGVIMMAVLSYLVEGPEAVMERFAFIATPLIVPGKIILPCVGLILIAKAVLLYRNSKLKPSSTRSSRRKKDSRTTSF